MKAAKPPYSSHLWAFIKEYNQILVCIFLVAQNVWWLIYSPTVLSTVIFGAGVTFMAATTRNRSMMWAWVALLLWWSTLNTTILTKAEQTVVSSPTISFIGK